MSAILEYSRRILACGSLVGLLLFFFILFFLISCATCPLCPPEDAVFPVMTPMGPIVVRVDKDFFNENNRDKYWATLEDFIEKREKIERKPDKQLLKEVNPDGPI